MRLRTYFKFPLINDFRSHTKLNINGKSVDVYDPVKGHTGIDIACLVGTPISLPIDLTLKAELHQKQMGLCAYFEDSEKNILIFAHLSQILAKKGERVAANDPLVITGNTGEITTGAHLHFEIIAPKAEKDGEVMTRSVGGFSGWNIDPVPYLDTVLSSPVLSDLEWHFKHFPELPKEWLQTKADNDPSFLLFSRLHALRLKEWFKN